MYDKIRSTTARNSTGSTGSKLGFFNLSFFLGLTLEAWMPRLGSWFQVAHLCPKRIVGTGTRTQSLVNSNRYRAHCRIPPRYQKPCKQKKDLAKHSRLAG